MCGIYKITNTINNKVYIGQSTNIPQRWKAHRSRPFQKEERYEQNYLYRAIRKYGLENFSFEIIELCKQEELNEKEKYWISYYQSNIENFGYNRTIGGDNAATFCKINNEQLKEVYELLQNSSLTQKEIANKFNVAESLISGINHGTVRPVVGAIYPLRKIPISTIKAEEKCICPYCGEVKSRKSNMCISCSAKMKQRTERPTREELKDLIRTKTFVQIGEYYGVSDNAIRKWCDAYNLPRNKKTIKSFTEEEWELL